MSSIFRRLSSAYYYIDDCHYCSYAILMSCMSCLKLSWRYLKEWLRFYDITLIAINPLPTTSKGLPLNWERLALLSLRENWLVDSLNVSRSCQALGAIISLSYFQRKQKRNWVSDSLLSRWFLSILTHNCTFLCSIFACF